MLQLHEYVLEKKCNFVCFEVSESSCKDLEDWCKSVGFDLTKNFNGDPIDKFDFHVTIYYTHPYVKIPQKQEKIEPIKTRVTGIDLFGQEKNIPVLKIEVTPEMQTVRNEYTKLGLTSEFPTWETHVSVSYNYKNEVDINSIELPKFDIFLDKVVSKISYKK